VLFLDRKMPVLRFDKVESDNLFLTKSKYLKYGKKVISKCTYESSLSLMCLEVD